MLRLVAIASVVALANAAGHIQLDATRDTKDSVSLFTLRDEVEKMKQNIFTLDGAKTMLLQTEAMANNAQVSFDRLATVNADSAQILGSLKAVENQIAKEHETAKGVIDDALLDTAARIKDVEDKLASKVRDNAALLSTLEDSTASVSQMQDAIAAMTDATAQMTGSINTQVDAKIAAVSENLDGLKEVNRHIWSGGAKRTHQSGGWHDFQYDREEFNTAAPYFKKESNERMKVLIDGIYHMSWTWMGYCHWSHRHAQMYVNGQNLNSNMHMWSNSWQTNHVAITWRVQANHQLWLRVYACNHAWHGSNNIDSYNRFRMEYLGEFPKDKCEGVACRGH